MSDLKPSTDLVKRLVEEASVMVVKEITGVYMERTLAENHAYARRKAGAKCRIFPRSVRAAGIYQIVYVTVEEREDEQSAG